MSDSTAAKQIGECWDCGGPIYEFLAHQCSTAVKLRCLCFEAGRNPMCPLHGSWAGTPLWETGK